MRRITNRLRPRRRGRALVAAVILALMGTTAVAWADNPGVINWPAVNPDTFRQSGGETLLDLEDNKNFAFMDIPAGTYHVSGELSAANGTYFDQNLSCSLYASAEGDPGETVLDTAASAMLHGLNSSVDGGHWGDYYNGGFGAVVELAQDGRLWVQCTGTETNQPDQDPTPDGPDGDEPEYVGVDVWLYATEVNTGSD
jgi:hypothetical protein